MKKLTLLAAFFSLAILLPQDIQAQDKASKKKKSKKDQPSEQKKEEDKFGDITKKCVKFDGLFVMYQDTVTGKSYIEIKEDQLNKEFIYFNHVENAPPGTGYFKGSFGGSEIIRFQKNFEKIDVIEENTSFYFDPSNAISKSKDANINRPILTSEKIEAVSTDKTKYLLDADGIFLSEKLRLVKMPMPPGMSPRLGSLNASKTRLDKVNNYSENTEVLVSYVFDNSSPMFSNEAITDARYVTISIQHSLIAVPENNYQPRFDDPRIGYFTTQVTDMTSFEAAPYRDVIHRWNLEKKDPNVALSEPIKPITYWIENTTPIEYREIIQSACERWNEAFEKAGFKNAIVCKVQPDTATWDAGDIRYNVIRWTSSSEPPFGGYGPSFVNPRTGEILGADIMLEWVAISNRVKFDGVFTTDGLMTDEKLDFMREHQIRNPMFCAASEFASMQTAFGVAAATTLSVDKAAEKEIVQQMLYRLVLHEVGHTLGLTHNMRASTMQSIQDIKNPAKIEKEGLCNSVMEYPAFNYQAKKEEQALYCDVKTGPYDKWVIEYGYSTAHPDMLTEKLRLKKITDRSTDPNLAYGNDADDMRSSGKGIDPDVNIYDLSNDPVAYAAERCDLVNAMLPKLQEKFTKSNQSYEELRQAYMLVTGEYGNQIRVMTRQIGGVHYDRSYFGQATEKIPLQPVSEDKQRAAMKALTKYAFAPNVLSEATPLYNYLLAQRRGFDHFAASDDPKIHSRIATMQVECLNHLLHPNVAQRVIDSQLYGNTYTYDEYMSDLTSALFDADAKTGVNTIRQTIQVVYVRELIAKLNLKEFFPAPARSVVLFELKKIDKMMATGVSPDNFTKAHREYVRQMIKDALEA